MQYRIEQLFRATTALQCAALKHEAQRNDFGRDLERGIVSSMEEALLVATDAIKALKRDLPK